MSKILGSGVPGRHETVWMWCFSVFFAAIIFAAFGLTSVASSQVISDLNLIDESRREQYQQKFKLEENGTVIEGVIRAPDDPIDYSPILNDEILKSFFVQTALGCDSSTHYCDDFIYRWDDEEFRLKIFQEGNFLSTENISLVRDPLEYVLAATGISVDGVPELERANLVIYLGSIEFLWRKSRQNRDAKAIKYFENERATGNQASLTQRLLGKNRLQVYCYTSNKDRSRRGVSVIYLTRDGLKSCYPGSLMEVLDLHSTDLNVPSVTDTKSLYKGLTHFDLVVFKLLDSTDVPIERDLGAVNSLWSSQASKVRAEIDENTLSSWRSPEADEGAYQ